MARENGTRTSDLAMLDSTWQQGVGCLFHQHSSRSSSPSRYQFDMRRLCFEYGSSIEFQVCYSITVLQSSDGFDTQEQVANFHDATRVLHKAREALNKPKHTANLVLFTDILQATLDEVKKNPNLRHCVQKALHELQYKPEWDLDNLILEKWHDGALTFLRDLEPLTSDLELQNEVNATRDSVKSIYDDMILVVEQENLIVVEPRFTPEESPSPPRLHQLHMKLAAIQEVDARSMLSAAERFHELLDVYDDLYLVFPELMNQSEIRWPQVLDDAFFAIRIELSMLLNQPGIMRSLTDQEMYTNMDVLLKGCCHALVSRIKMPVQDYLSKYLQYLQQRVSDTAGLELEHLFHELASKVEVFSMRTPKGVADTEWVKYAPRVFADTRSQNFLNKLQCLHAAYQKKAYTSHEISRLWFAIWQSLKTTYLIARKHEFNLNKPEFPVEIEFFGKMSIRNQFETVLSGPDALYPSTIENIVAEYCTLISLCQERPDLEYNMLKQLRAGTVQESVFENVENYTKTQAWDDVAVRSMQKCAVGLNHSLGGPAYIRRMDPRGSAFSKGAISEWSIAKIDLTPFKDPSSVLQSVSTFIQSQESSKSMPLSRTSSMSSVQKVTKTKRNSSKSAISQYDDEGTPGNEHKTNMDGRHMVSAFDHVVYPFPETRAIEVAQSRQITREMSESGIYSRGALPEDVVNRPPRHTWPPGTISVWAKPLPIDPINVVKHLWSDWRNGSTKRSSLRQPRPQPAITARTPRRDWVDEHPRLRPLLDRKNRVSKPAPKADDTSTTNSPRGSTHSHMGTPMLRGGGSSPSLPDYESPSPSPRSIRINALNQISLVERRARLDLLYQRVRGFWPIDENPRADALATVFMDPVCWDVDAAYVAIRQMAELGLLAGMTHQHNHLLDLDQPDQVARPRSNMVDALDDPFIGPGPNMELYTLPANRVHHHMNGVDRFINGHHHHVNGGQPIQNGFGFLDTPMQPQRQVNDLRQPLQTLLGAQLLPGGGSDVITDSVDTDNAFGPAPFVARPGPVAPAPPNTPPDSYPAPNQQHQAQIDRARANLPPLQQNDNHADLDNQSPQPTQQIQPTPGPGLVQSQGPCIAQLCHPCPTYTGLFHHVCAIQGPRAIPGNTTTSPNLTQLADSFLDSLGPIVDANTQPSPRAPAVGPSLNGARTPPVRPSSPRPATNGAQNQQTDSTSVPNGAGMPTTTNNVQTAVGNSTSGNPANTASILVPATPAVNSASPTRIAGHSLRNRTRLSAQRAARAARLDLRDTGSVIETPTRAQQASTTTPVAPQDLINSPSGRASSDNRRDPDWLPEDPAERRAHSRRRILRQQTERNDPHVLQFHTLSDSSPDELTARNDAMLQQMASTRRTRQAASTPRRRGTGALRGRGART